MNRIDVLLMYRINSMVQLTLYHLLSWFLYMNNVWLMLGIYFNDFPCRLIPSLEVAIDKKK